MNEVVFEPIIKRKKQSEQLSIPFRYRRRRKLIRKSEEIGQRTRISNFKLGQGLYNMFSFLLGAGVLFLNKIGSHVQACSAADLSHIISLGR